MPDSLHLAIDLGASGGRVALGRFDGRQLRTQIVHRFWNGAVPVPHESGDRLHWDILGLWQGILTGLDLARRMAADRGEKIASVAVDSWAVDYALLDEKGRLLGNPIHYRDARTEGWAERLSAQISPAHLYAETGIQTLPFNTLYQLLAHAEEDPETLARARSLLLIPDLIHYWLCGARVAERTNASTTQFYNPQTRDWSPTLLNLIGLKREVLPEIVDPATWLGTLRPELGFGEIPVVATASHDTAAAVAAIPLAGEGDAYISSGTWSLVGIQSDRPILTPEAQAANFTNEVGVDGTIRFLKNVMGLWILQECRRAWGEPDYDSMYRQAAIVSQQMATFDPDNEAFLRPGSDMPQRVLEHADPRTGKVPESDAEIVRSIFESLAFRYGTVFDALEQVAGRKLQRVHIVGGGSRVKLLNQLTYERTGRQVIPGVMDGSLTGNLLVQLQALGEVSASERTQVEVVSDAAHA